MRAVVLHDEVRTDAGIERDAHLLVEQQRILAQLLRKETFGEPGHEHDLEGATARLVRAADEHAPVAVGRRLLVEGSKAFGQHVARFLEADRADGAHRAKLAEHAQHARGPAEHPRRQLAEALEPLAPRRVRRPGRERLDDRERELREVREILPVALDAGQPRRFGIVAQAFFLDLRVVALAQAPEPATPALRITADHRCFDDQSLPFPRRTETTFDDG